MTERTWNGASLSSKFLLLRAIRGELAKLCLSPVFLLGICGTALLLALEYYKVFVDFQEESFTLLEMMALHGKEWIAQNAKLTVEEILMAQPGRQLMDYVTVLAPLPFLALFCGERKTGSLRGQIFCLGRGRYYVSKLLSGMLVGGLLTGLGYFVFVICLIPFFPHMDPTILELYGIGQTKSYIAYSIVGMFAYGMVAAIWGMLLSAFTKDIYLCLTIPFLMKWVNVIFCNYLDSYLYNGAEGAGGRWFGILKWWREKGRLEQVIYEMQGGKLLKAAGILVGLALFGGAVFVWRMNRRVDYGN